MPPSATAHIAIAAPAPSGGPSVRPTAILPNRRPVRGAESATRSAAPATAAIAVPPAPDSGHRARAVLAGEPRQGGGVERRRDEHRGFDQPVGGAILADVRTAGVEQAQEDDARAERGRSQEPEDPQRKAGADQVRPPPRLDA